MSTATIATGRNADVRRTAAPGTTRRSFVKLAGAGLAGIGLAGARLAASPFAPRAARADEAPSQVIVTMTTSSEPASGFDPLRSWGCGEHVHEPLIQSTLIVTDTELEFKNDLATSYECSDDGLTWTFTIRDDVKFTDGEPLTASDVAFTINGVINSTASEADLSMVKEAVATDDTTVVLTMEKPFNALLYTLAVLGIVPEHAYGDDYGAHPIGSGRYMLEQWDQGQQAILVANPDYYGEAPTMQRVVVVFMEEDASIAAAQAGQVDVAYTSATFSDVVPAGYSLFACTSVDSRGVSLPCVPAGGQKEVDGVTYEQGNDVTCDVAVRRAINYGMDRDLLIANVLNGYGTPAFSVGDGLPRRRLADELPRDRHRGQPQGWELGRDLRPRVLDAGRVGLGLQRPHRDVPAQLLDRLGQLRELRERGRGRPPRRGARPAQRGGLLRALEARAVGRHRRRGPAGSGDVGVVHQHRPPLLRARGPADRRAEAAPPRARLVAREQRGPVELGVEGPARDRKAGRPWPSSSSRTC